MELIESFRWSIENYYAITGGCLALTMYVLFRLAQVDPDHNTIVGALIGGAIMAIVAYFTRDMGLAGTIGTCVTIFGVLLGFSGGEAAKAFMVSFACIGVFSLTSHRAIDNSPLTPDDLGGLARVTYNGSLDEEPVDDKQLYSRDLYKNSKPPE